MRPYRSGLTLPAGVDASIVMAGAAARGTVAPSVNATASRHALFIFVSVCLPFGRNKDTRHDGREDIKSRDRRVQCALRRCRQLETLREASCDGYLTRTQQEKREKRAKWNIDRFNTQNNGLFLSLFGYMARRHETPLGRAAATRRRQLRPRRVGLRNTGGKTPPIG